ncbi:hypothetical protein D9M72_613240 [compost metagenome]
MVIRLHRPQQVGAKVPQAVQTQAPALTLGQAKCIQPPLHLTLQASHPAAQ